MTWIIKDASPLHYLGPGKGTSFVALQSEARRFPTLEAARQRLKELYALPLVSLDAKVFRLVPRQPNDRCIACGSTVRALVKGRPLCEDALSCHAKELRDMPMRPGGWRTPLLPGTSREGGT